MARIAARERVLSARLAAGLASVPGLQPVVLWSDPPVDRVGLATFNLEGYRHPLLAAILSAEHAIGVRHGCFCAHPLLAHLLGVPFPRARYAFAAETRAGGRPELPGRRARELRPGHQRAGRRPAGRRRGRSRPTGPRWGYLHDSAHDEYRPAPDTRALPLGGRPRPALRAVRAAG